MITNMTGLKTPPLVAAAAETNMTTAGITDMMNIMTTTDITNIMDTMDLTIMTDTTLMTVFSGKIYGDV